ncbi:iron-sulfur cluster assembly scaffold protein [Novosphingobium mangrovi (ex Huang et al. 2023)]|uniref:Iron-sulfur cluster assembly scaffold protein n=1 Tax=Novosphingobium mangrovi (ex Huang et al. 2023) TaxID=2976432 RepID=A0ABT2IAL7_9SPHN|nr:iron-sulfur cluster assembly scaffold protein [Novosphingobium mangrovi (ex Huang et al. 2023)]MCT2401872.1 iron-sulfur cluster assembly scaffold protein [Novosphingobium mangrovi (ex Huang et al. 2023)]
MSTAVLYTPDVLGLAIELARFPLSEDLPLHAEARSKSCGSTIALGLATAPDGTISRVGVRSQACAIGQASAAIFAQGACGRGGAEIHAVGKAVADWLAGEGAMPDWPGLSVIAAARDYPARHGAVMLPWNAAMQVLPLDRAEV